MAMTERFIVQIDWFDAPTIFPRRHFRWKVVVVEGRHWPAKATGAEQLFGVERAIWLSKLNVVFFRELSQLYVSWHRRLQLIS